jgi:AcrR family transcriptional regulator
MYTVRQKEIIGKSIKLIAEKGIQGFTIRNLAHEVKVTESALYRHFKSKGGILCAILKIFEQELNGFIEKLKPMKMSSLEKIEYVFDAHIDRFVKNPALVSVLFAEEIFKNEKELASRMNVILQINHNNFSDIIKEGQAKGEIRDELSHDQLAMVALATIRLTVKKWELSKYSFNLLEEGEKIKETIRVLYQK